MRDEDRERVRSAEKDGVRPVRPLDPPSLDELRETPFDGDELDDDLRDLLGGS